MKCFLDRYFIGIATCITLMSSAFAANNFVPIRLPYGVQVEIPRNWVALSNNKRITLDSSVQARLERSEMFDASSDLHFAANYYDDSGKIVALMNVRYFPDSETTQADSRTLRQSDINQLDISLHEEILKSAQAFGFSVLVWNGSRKQVINGLTAFVTEYKRSPSNNNGNYKVRLVNIFNGGKSFGLTVSYREDQEYILRPICDRIISSIRN